MNRYLYTLCLLLFAAVTFAQQNLKQADRLYNEYAYIDAAAAYEAYLKDEKQPGIDVMKKAADSYYFTGNTAGALRWYTRLDEVLSTGMDDTYFNRYLQSLRAEENYAKADEVLKKRLEAKGDAAMTKRFIAEKKYLDSLIAKPSNYTIINLASNSDKADFGTAFYGNQIVYSSSKDTAKVGGKTYKWNDQPFLELYVADRNAGDGSFFNEKKFIPKDQTKYHNATLAFTPDLKTVFYSANNLKKNGRLNSNDSRTNNIEIIKGTVNGEKLDGVEKLPFNNKDYSVGHPSISADGRWLYFASDMPGGYGDSDIYVAELFSDGKVGTPKNLGPKINTSGREMFPFINDSILYFSSDGHYGLGGLDVFESPKVKDIEFSEPKNLGKPINSNVDDFAFIIDNERKYGYVSSSRKGGRGDDDIYYFTRTEPVCVQSVSGKVMSTKYKIPIYQADIKVYDKYGDMLANAKTKEDGTYTIEVPCGAQLTVEASKANHSTAKKNLQTTKQLGAETKNVNFELSNFEDLVRKEDNMEKVDINPIYFDFNKWEISPQAATELDKVVYVMQNFPAVVINIESHTDSRGNDNYNMHLSENRAKATYDYILSKGIEASRIKSVKGYGESRLRNKCKNGIACTDTEHQMNRRSDFIIIKK